MSFRVEPAFPATVLGDPEQRCWRRVEDAVKGGRSSAKRTLEGVLNAHALRGLGLVAAFRGQRPSPFGGKDFTALGGAGPGVGAPEALRGGILLAGGGSTQNH
jgi:hypothetical protein